MSSAGRGTEEFPAAARAPALCRPFDRGGLFTVLSDRGRFRSGPSRVNAQGLWRFSRHPIRPVLKHGPRSLTCARVMGFCTKPKGAMKVKGNLRSS